MPLAQEQENLQPDRIERIGKTERFEGESEKVAEQPQETIEQVTPQRATETLESKKPKSQEKYEAIDKVLESKPIKVLEEELIKMIENSPSPDSDTEIDKKLNEITRELSNSDIGDGNVTAQIVSIEEKADKQVKNIGPWLQKELNNRISEARKNPAP